MEFTLTMRFVAAKRERIEVSRAMREPLVDLACANAWVGRDADAKAAAAALLKAFPDFTVQGCAGVPSNDNPIRKAQFQGMSEGLR